MNNQQAIRQLISLIIDRLEKSRTFWKMGGVCRTHVFWTHSWLPPFGSLCTFAHSKFLSAQKISLLTLLNIIIIVVLWGFVWFVIVCFLSRSSPLLDVYHLGLRRTRFSVLIVAIWLLMFVWIYFGYLLCFQMDMDTSASDPQFVLSAIVDAHGSDDVKALQSTSKGVIISGGRDDCVRFWARK